MDASTEALMQDVIDNEFSSRTVLAVVHRLQYIEKFDKIAVLDRGTLIEFDSPNALLGRDSVLAEMCRAGNTTEESPPSE